MNANRYAPVNFQIRVCAVCVRVYLSRQMWSVVIRCYKNLWLFENRNEPHYLIRMAGAFKDWWQCAMRHLIQKRFVIWNAYIPHTHTHTQWDDEQNQSNFYDDHEEKSGNKFIYRKNLVFCFNENDTFTGYSQFWQSCIVRAQLNCKWNIEMIMNLITLWKQAKEQVDRKDRSDHSLKRWNLVCAAIFFLSTVH